MSELNKNYKPGQYAVVKSLSWYNKNKNKDNRIYFNESREYSFIKEMTLYCGQLIRITKYHYKGYRVEVQDGTIPEICWQDWMLNDATIVKLGMLEDE